MPLEAAARQALWHKLHSALTFEPCEVLLQTLSRHRDRHRGELFGRLIVLATSRVLRRRSPGAIVRSKASRRSAAHG